MTNSVDKILEKIHQQSSNLRNATPQIVQRIFSNLSVGKISQLCQTSHSFNFVCKEESLWKNKLRNDYGVEINSKRTWREEAKVVFLESEQFWETIDEDIDYFMTNGMDYMGDSKVENDLGDEAGDFVNKFEKDLVDHALREEKEFYAAKLIFRSFYNTDRYIDSLEDDGYYVNFIPLFEKLAELSPRGKISLKWVLGLNHIQEVKLTQIEDMYPLIDLTTIEHDTKEYKIQWKIYNRDLYFSIMNSLASLYMYHQDLFINDTTADQKDVMVMLNHWEDF